MLLHHVAEAADYVAARGAGRDYVPAGFAAEGFIHLCTAAQLAGVLERYFRGRSGLVLLTLDEGRLPEAPRWEGAVERFPHLYAPLPLAAVAGERALSVDDAGRERP